MTPCEKLGYKVGDRFRVIESRHPSRNGSIVTLQQDDGSHAPYFTSEGGYQWVFRIDSDLNDRIEKIEDAKDTLTTILESAADHGAKAKHHAAEYERLTQQARDMLPDGWMLVRGGVDRAEGQDMSNPANWRPGDMVECACNYYIGYSRGCTYQVSGFASGSRIPIIDEDGDAQNRMTKNFRFHHRPNT